PPRQRTSAETMAASIAGSACRRSSARDREQRTIEARSVAGTNQLRHQPEIPPLRQRIGRYSVPACRCRLELGQRDGPVSVRLGHGIWIEPKSGTGNVEGIAKQRRPAHLQVYPLRRAGPKGDHAAARVAEVLTKGPAKAHDTIQLRRHACHVHDDAVAPDEGVTGHGADELFVIRADSLPQHGPFERAPQAEAQLALTDRVYGSDRLRAGAQHVEDPDVESNGIGVTVSIRTARVESDVTETQQKPIVRDLPTVRSDHCRRVLRLARNGHDQPPWRR